MRGFRFFVSRQLVMWARPPCVTFGRSSFLGQERLVEALLEALPFQSDSVVLSESLVEASSPFVGRWSRLVSTTNWEKGRIIDEWRRSLVDDGLPVAEYSD